MTHSSVLESYVITFDAFEYDEVLSLTPAGSCVIIYNMNGAISTMRSVVDQFNNGFGNPRVQQVDYSMITIDSMVDPRESMGGHQGVIW